MTMYKKICMSFVIVSNFSSLGAFSVEALVPNAHYPVGSLRSMIHAGYVANVARASIMCGRFAADSAPHFYWQEQKYKYGQIADQLETTNGMLNKILESIHPTDPWQMAAIFGTVVGVIFLAGYLCGSSGAQKDTQTES